MGCVASNKLSKAIPISVRMGSGHFTALAEMKSGSGGPTFGGGPST